MVRLLLKDKKEGSYFKQFAFLKQNLDLSLFKCIELFFVIKKGKELLIQGDKEDTVVNILLDRAYWRSKNYFTVELTDINYGIQSFVDINEYTELILPKKRKKKIRIFISK